MGWLCDWLGLCDEPPNRYRDVRWHKRSPSRDTLQLMLSLDELDERDVTVDQLFALAESLRKDFLPASALMVAELIERKLAAARSADEDMYDRLNRLRYQLYAQGVRQLRKRFAGSRV